MSSEVENEVLPSSPEEEDSSLRGPRPEINDVGSSLEGSSSLEDEVQEVQSSGSVSDLKSDKTATFSQNNDAFWCTRKNQKPKS